MVQRRGSARRGHVNCLRFLLLQQGEEHYSCHLRRDRCSGMQPLIHACFLLQFTAIALKPASLTVRVIPGRTGENLDDHRGVCARYFSRRRAHRSWVVYLAEKFGIPAVSQALNVFVGGMLQGLKAVRDQDQAASRKFLCFMPQLLGSESDRPISDREKSSTYVYPIELSDRISMWDPLVCWRTIRPMQIHL